MIHLNRLGGGLILIIAGLLLQNSRLLAVRGIVPGIFAIVLVFILFHEKIFNLALLLTSTALIVYVFQFFRLEYFILLGLGLLVFWRRRHLTGNDFYDFLIGGELVSLGGSVIFGLIGSVNWSDYGMIIIGEGLYNLFLASLLWPLLRWYYPKEK